MSSKSIAKIALRIVGVYFVTKAIADGSLVLSARLGLRSDMINTTQIFLSIFPYITYLLIGLIAWIKTNFVVNLILADSDQTIDVDKITDRESLLDLQAIAFSITGLIIVMLSLFVLFQFVASTTLLEAFEGSSGFKSILKANFVGRLITLAIGMVLLLKPRRISEMIKSI